MGALNALHKQLCDRLDEIHVHAHMADTGSNWRPQAPGCAGKSPSHVLRGVVTMLGNGLLALACGTFALGISEFSTMGILSALAHDMRVSIPQAGDFISAYALGVSVGAPLPLFFRNYPLKYILIGLCCLIILGNCMAAASNGYFILLGSRFMSGLPHGGYFGVAAIVAVNLVDQGQKATAVAIMVAGMTVANIAGVPLATWLAYAYSWRFAYLGAAIWGAIAMCGITLSVPKMAPRTKTGMGGEFSFLKRGAPWLIFLATFLGQGSVYCWFSYMEPIMLRVGHLPPQYMKWVMALAGLGMFTGGILCGRLSDRYRPSLVCMCTALIMIPILVAIYFFSWNLWVAVPLVFAGTAALFGLGGPMQYLIVRFSRGGAILGGAGIQIAFNMSNACAAWLGGMAINRGLGLTSPALIGVPMAAICALVLLRFSMRYKKLGA